MRMFEYGAGSSTLYYARRVQSVVAVEHDAAFAQILSPHLPTNARMIVEPAYSEAYVRAIERAGGPFDLIAVDGRDRVRCAEAAIPRLSADGVLVLDDAERPDYQVAITRLADAGFRRLDFWGLAPGVVDGKSTAVFYRSGNILGI
jgi:predicted O-methyltransferase YrrM